MLRNVIVHVSTRFARTFRRRTDFWALCATAILMPAHPSVAASAAVPQLMTRPAPIVQKQSFDYIGPSGGRTISLAQFDAMGGARTLVDVVLELRDTSTWVFHVQAHNNALVDNTVTAELRSDVQASAASNLRTALALSKSETATIGPLQTADFGDLTDVGSSSANLASMPNQSAAPYVGLGTIDITVSNLAALDVRCSVPDCASTVSISHDQWRILATLRLTYVYVDSPTSIDPQGITQRGMSLGTPRPNPWRGENIAYFPVHMPGADQVEMEMYDVTGRRVAHRARTWLAAGDHLVPWVPPSLAAGIYTVRLRTPRGATSTGRWTVLR